VEKRSIHKSFTVSGCSNHKVMREACCSILRGSSVSNDSSFHDLIRRVRCGSQEAAAELVRQYEPAIKTAIRQPLIKVRLQRLLDATDISQSVLATFFLRAAAGHFHLSCPEELHKLLVTMARNKVRDEARKHQAYRRDKRRIEGQVTGGGLDTLLDRTPSPGEIVAGNELVRELYRQLSAEERYLAEQRTLGHEWVAIAGKLGRSPAALRKQLTRAIDRASRNLGLSGHIL
jgi:RNA polymerase sigma-70 factor (ECF subfamily)